VESVIFLEPGAEVCRGGEEERLGWGGFHGIGPCPQCFLPQSHRENLLNRKRRKGCPQDADWEQWFFVALAVLCELAVKSFFAAAHSGVKQFQIADFRFCEQPILDRYFPRLSLSAGQAIEGLRVFPHGFGESSVVHELAVLAAIDQAGFQQDLQVVRDRPG
jgi:hypothetical protein